MNTIFVYCETEDGETNEAKADNLLQTVIGTDEKQMQGYRDRLQIREVQEIRLAREIVLEPRR